MHLVAAAHIAGFSERGVLESKLGVKKTQVRSLSSALHRPRLPDRYYC